MINTFLLVVVSTTAVAQAPPKPSLFDTSGGVVVGSPTTLPTGLLLGGGADLRVHLGGLWRMGIRADLASVTEYSRVTEVQHTEARFFGMVDKHIPIEVAELGLRAGVGPTIVWESLTPHNTQIVSNTYRTRSRVFLGGQLEGVLSLPLIPIVWLELSAGVQTTWVNNQLGVGNIASGRLRFHL